MPSSDSPLSSNLVAELRADVVVPYKDGYTPMRVPPGELRMRAAAEIERLTSDFRQVHHNCIHAREVADKALALLSEVDAMPGVWQKRRAEVAALAQAVPPLHSETTTEHPLDPRMIEACEVLRSLLMQCKPYMVKADREGPHAHPRVLLNQINAALDSPPKTSCFDPRAGIAKEPQ